VTQDITLAVISGVLSAAMLALARGMWTQTLRDAVNVLGGLLAVLCVVAAIGAALATG
jgi:hypothetical protein